MSTTAIVMMIVAIVLVWGGLILAIINIRRSPEEIDELDPDYPEQPDHTDPRQPRDQSQRPDGDRNGAPVR